jgi:hypothetical protein
MRRPEKRRTEQPLSPRFRFEPGTYGGAGRFMPSIACLKQTAPNTWDYHFVLVKPQQMHPQEDTATSEAEKDLQMAFQRKEESGSDYAVAEYLRAQGYVSVTGFQVVND